jgi:hypothetical protein
MASDRTPLRATAAIQRRPAVSTRVQRSAVEKVRSPAQTLQQRIGNRATQVFIARSAATQSQTQAAVHVAAPPSIQRLEHSTKRSRLPAKVSKARDPAELEAEETARKVMRMSQPPAPKPTASTPPIAKAVTTGTAQRAEASSAVPTAPAPPSRVSIPGGSPLPSAVRSHMEPRFGANFGNVRVHTGDAAAKHSASVNAHAFTVGDHIFFGRDQYQPQSAGGRELIAHELTHTIQQEAVVQRQVDATVTQRSEPQVHRLGISDALNWIADKANYLPGFRLLTIVLGMNPINFAPVERSAANILRALLEMIPVIGPLLAQALEGYGIFTKVGTWVEGQIKTLGLVGGGLKSALDKFLDSLSWSDIFRLDDVYERGKRIFTEPISRLIEFGKSLVVTILGFIREAILVPLAGLAAKTRGYDLLKAVLGEDPVTGEKVVPTPELLIGGFMKLIGQEEVWERIKKANALPRAWAWFKGALDGLKGFVSQVPTLFLNTLKSLEIIDLVIPPKAFIKVAGAFGSFALQFITWAGNTVWTLLEIVFDVVSPGAFAYIKKTGAALKGILTNPLPFMGNLVKAAKLGFQKFADNIGSHLKAGLIDWLTGSLEGVYIPKALSLPELGKFALSVLGISWAQIRAKIVKALGPSGEMIMKGLETTFDIVVALVTGGPAAAWELIKDKLTDLKDQVVSGIIGFVTDAVVKKAIPKLIAMFIPGAGFISAIITIYDTIKTFIEQLTKIIQVVKAFVDSIVAIAAGNIADAANRVEGILSKLLSLAISFLAGFLGLGKITDKIKEVIEKIRATVDKALDSVITWIVDKAKALFASGKAAVGSIVAWWKEKLGFTNKAGETHTLQFMGEGESAKLGIETTLMSVRAYLDNHPEKGTPDWVTADSVFSAAMQVIYSPAAKTQQEKERRQQITQQLAKISAAFAKLGGEPPEADDYEKTTAATYASPPKVEVIVDKPQEGTRTGAWPTTKPGYKEIYDAGLTTATDPWVQMHIISEKLGGSGTDFENLVPAPQSVNLGPFRSFEHKAATLASGKSGKIKNRVWVEVAVSGGKTAASGLLGKAGLWLWKGKKAAPKWMKNETPSLSVSAGIPKPQLSGTRKLVLNFTSGTEMQRDFGISSATATLVKEGRPYASQAHFVKSITDRGATAGQVNAILNRNPALNGP